MTSFHSTIAANAYHDLLSLLLDENISEIRGKPTLRHRNGRGYWYDRFRIGNEIKERYLGEDYSFLRDRLEKADEIRNETKVRQRERARLVRLLRSERFLGLDSATGSLLAALANAGVFRLGGVLVGTTAFRFYEGELGIKLSLDQAALTNDIDIASFERLSLALGESVKPGLADVFNDFRFSAVSTLERGKTWRWRQSEAQTLVEFLTPSFSEDEGLRDLPSLGVSARALHHLNYLIAEPIPAAGIYRSGILTMIPRPERFAIHKLIVADRRSDGPDSLKSRKDIMQADILTAVLAKDRPTDLADALEDALSRGPQWRRRIEASLRRAPEIAERLGI